MERLKYFPSAAGKTILRHITKNTIPDKITIYELKINYAKSSP
jgi:hypothetical protein